MDDQNHAEPRRSPNDPGLAFVEPDEFRADPAYYVGWVCDNQCDLAVQKDGKKLLVGLAVVDSASSTEMGPTVAVDPQTFIANVDDVVEVLRSGRLKGELKFSGRREKVFLFSSESKGVLSSVEDVDYTLPLADLVEQVQQERVRQESEKSAAGGEEPDVEHETGDASNDVDADDNSGGLDRRSRLDAKTAKKVAIRTVKVATEKVAVPTAKYVAEVWRDRSSGVTKRVVADAKKQVKQLRDRGLGR